MHSLSLAGADAAIIVNTRMGPELFAMGGSERISRVPAIFISKGGERLRELLACTKGGVVLELAAHEAVSEARPPPLEVCPPCVTGGMPAAPDVGRRRGRRARVAAAAVAALVQVRHGCARRGRG